MDRAGPHAGIIRSPRHNIAAAAGIVGRSKNDPVTAPGSATRAVLARLPDDNKPRSVHLPDHLGDYRILVMKGDDGDLLVTGLPAQDVDETTGQLIVIEAIVFGIALALVAVATTVSVRVTLAPLTRMAETASRVADLPLSSGTVSLPERAPQADAHTEVGTLSTAFNGMLEHVEAALHQRQQSEDRLRRFVADASHELRTPVAVIRGHAELAQRVGTGASSEVEHSLARIEAESRRMGHLVDDLLLLARLDSGRPLAREEVDLSRLVLDAVSDARVAGPDHRWQLDLPPEPVTVIGDEHALHQVVANLLANGRTHTPAGTTVLVEVGIVGGRGGDRRRRRRPGYTGRGAARDLRPLRPRRRRPLGEHRQQRAGTGDRRRHRPRPRRHHRGREQTRADPVHDQLGEVVAS